MKTNGNKKNENMELDCKDQVAGLAAYNLKNLSKTRQREPERWKLAPSRVVKLFILKKLVWRWKSKLITHKN